MRADSESAIIINKTNFSYVLQAISVYYLQKHPHATAISPKSGNDTSEVCKIHEILSG